MKTDNAKFLAKAREYTKEYGLILTCLGFSHRCYQPCYVIMRVEPSVEVSRTIPCNHTFPSQCMRFSSDPTT